MSPCETCRGSGYTAEAWEVRLNGLALPDVFGRTIDEVYHLFGDDPRLRRPLQAARQVGLGYLVLRQPGYALSGGEAQRLKIARSCCRHLHPARSTSWTSPPSVCTWTNVQRLTGVLHRLVTRAAQVIGVEHHTHLLAAWLADRVGSRRRSRGGG